MKKNIIQSKSVGNKSSPSINIKPILKTQDLITCVYKV